MKGALFSPGGGEAMVIIVLLYLALIWLIFFRLKWLPFNWTYGTIAVLLGVDKDLTRMPRVNRTGTACD
jgi:hypothetical protein